METLKLSLTNYKIHAIMIFVAVMLIFPFPKKESNWIKLSKNEKERIIKNKKIWQNMSEQEKRKWKICNDRFKRYSVNDQKFLFQVFNEWMQMPEYRKKQILASLKILNSLPHESQEIIKYQSIYLEGLNFETGNPVTPEDFGFCFCERYEDNCNFRKYKNLPPVQLRREIYRELATLKVVPMLPPNLQKYWKQLSIENRLKILDEIQINSEKHNRILLIQLLKQKIDEKND